MDKRNYEILSGDTLVAKWQNGNLEIINESLLPLFLYLFLAKVDCAYPVF